MKIIAYAHPPILAEGASFNIGWVYVLLDILRPLCAGNRDVEAALIIGARHAVAAQKTSLPNNLRLITVDENALHHELVAEGYSLSKLSATLMAEQWEEKGVGILNRHIARATKQSGWEATPDLILSFAVKADFLKQLWDATPVFHIEMAPFSRAPFPRSIFLDHEGIYNSSSIVRHAQQGKAWPSSDAGQSLAQDLRANYTAEIARANPFQHHDYHRRFEKLCLLPLQVSANFTFDEQSPYRTQLEYVTDMLAATPKDVGLVVTEYNHWQSYLDTLAPSRSLEYLKSHPSFIYPLKSRSMTAPSLFLAPMVDGVWTVSSNVGYIGLFFSKWLGAASGQFAPVAAANNPADLMAQLGKTAPVHDDLIGWMFERYYIPTSLYTDEKWMYPYLQKRVNSCREPKLGDAYPLLADTIKLRKAWEPQPLDLDYDLAFMAPDLWARKALAQEQFQDRKAPPVIEPTSFAGRVGRLKAELMPEEEILHTNPNSYFLLNDTSDVEENTDLGSASVTKFIHAKMHELNFSMRGSAIDQAGIDLLEQGPDFNDVKLIIFNGEGLMNQNRRRIFDLMAFCGRARAAGKRTILINSVYQDNSDEFGALLKYFDIVSVREPQSQQAMKAWRPDARVVPDFCFETLYKSTRPVWVRHAAAARPQAEAYSVIDSVLSNYADNLHDFARFHELPFFVMGAQHEKRYLSPEWLYQIDEKFFPCKLLGAGDLLPFTCGVTGRFHGLIALLLCRVAPLAWPSSTHEIEGLLEDMGLTDHIMLPSHWMDLGHNHRKDIADKLIARWDEAAWQRVEDYITKARSQINALFEDIGHLVATKPDIAPSVHTADTQRRQIIELNATLAKVYANHTHWLFSKLRPTINVLRLIRNIGTAKIKNKKSGKARNR